MRGGAIIIGVLLAACSMPPAADPARCAPGSKDCTLGKKCGSAADCAPDAGVACTKGVCSAPCSSGTCSAGQECLEIDGKPWCMFSCGDAPCAAGVACKMFWPQRKRVCAVADLGAACKAAVAEQSCNTCGQRYFTTECITTGRVCPGRSECNGVPPVECSCLAGVPTRCDGRPCDQTNPLLDCPPPDYFCDTGGLTSSTCTDDPQEFGARCQCADGRELPVVCDESSSCEHRCSIGCSITAQDCPDSWRPKCTYTFQRVVETFASRRLHDATECVALTGNKALGESCARTVAPDGGRAPGDDCAIGLVCETGGAPTGELRCRKLCTATSQCASGQVCSTLASTVPASGYCLPEAGCTLDGAECGAGKSCVFVAAAEAPARITYCKFNGPANVGEACRFGSDCGPNLMCTSGQCRRICSITRPCDAGTCFEYAGHDAGYPSVCL